MLVLRSGRDQKRKRHPEVGALLRLGQPDLASRALDDPPADRQPDTRSFLGGLLLEPLEHLKGSLVLSAEDPSSRMNRLGKQQLTTGDAPAAPSCPFMLIEACRPRISMRASKALSAVTFC